MIRPFLDRFNGNGVDGLWHKALTHHGLGGYSIALLQANSNLEYQDQVLTTPSVTSLGVYDGHGESQVSRFLREELFHRINNNASSYWGGDIYNRSSSNEKKPPGLSQDAIEALPLEIFCGENKESKECGICLERLKEGDKLICLPCNHRFHYICLNSWIRTCGDCPNCRNPIIQTR